MKQLFLALSAMALAACAAVETPITKDNNHIRTPHYSFVAPPGQGWRLVEAPNFPADGQYGEDVISLRKIEGVPIPRPIASDGRSRSELRS